MIAVILAGLAVFGARDLLNTQQERLLALNATQQQVQQAPAPVKEEPKMTIVVADEALRFGERITPDRLREIEWASDVIPTGSFQTIEEVIADDSEESARYVLSSMEIGEPILTTKITTPGVRAKLSTALTPGMKAVSIRVNDVLGVAGFVLPGDRVDILLTRQSREVAGGTFVDILLQGVKVLAIDQITDERKDNPSVSRTVTFEVTTEEAQKLVLAANVGTMSLALRNLASADIEENKRVTITDLSELDVAEDLIPDAVTNAENARFDQLEQALKGLTEGFSQRFEQVEAKIDETDSVEPEKPVQQITQLPTRVTVGVIRDGRRSEYSVQNEVDLPLEEKPAE